MLVWWKNKFIRFLIKVLERIFSEKLSELWIDLVGKRNFEKERYRVVGFVLICCFFIRFLCNIYFWCLINEIFFEEELIFIEFEEVRWYELFILK